MNRSTHVCTSHGPRALVALILATAVGACAGPQLERLSGEPESTHAFTKADLGREAPVVAGLKRFLANAGAGRTDLVYRQLSTVTKRALTNRAKPLGLHAAQLLAPPASNAGGGATKLHIADPVAVFALKGAREFVAGPTPYRPEKPHDGRTIEQNVTLKAADGRTRVVALRFEGLQWRVHNPKLQAPPAAASNP